MAKVKETPHLRLRVDASLLARLEKAAEKNGKTLTGEINHRLAESFKGDDFVSAIERLSERATVRIGDVTVKQGQWTREAEKK
jgi:hypothetical protein